MCEPPVERNGEQPAETKWPPASTSRARGACCRKLVRQGARQLAEGVTVPGRLEEPAEERNRGAGLKRNAGSAAYPNARLMAADTPAASVADKPPRRGARRRTQQRQRGPRTTRALGTARIPVQARRRTWPRGAAPLPTGGKGHHRIPRASFPPSTHRGRGACRDILREVASGSNQGGALEPHRGGCGCVSRWPAASPRCSRAAA